MVQNNINKYIYKKKLKINKKGITLISLIITVIIMLILVSVAFNIVLGDNGLLKKSKAASTSYTNSGYQEELTMGVADTGIDYLGRTPTSEEYADKLNEKMGNEIEWVYKDSLAGKYKGQDFTIYDGEVVMGVIDSHIIENTNVSPVYTNGGMAYSKYRAKISNITISIEQDLDKYRNGEVKNAVTNETLPDEEPNKYLPWNLSSHSEVNNVFAYLKKNDLTSIPASEGKPEDIYYDLFIVSNRKIYMPQNSAFFFSGFTKVQSINGLMNLDTSNVTNMNCMFADTGEGTLESLDLGDNFDTSNVTTMSSMFDFLGHRKIKTINLGKKFNTSKVTNMYRMFYSFGYESLTSLDLSSFDTFNVTNMSNMFAFCGFRTIKELNLGKNFDTSNVTDMSCMFEMCGSSLLNFKLGDKFDTSNVTNMKMMFYLFCQASPDFNLGDKFNTSKVTNMNSMFGHFAGGIRNLSLGNNFDTSNVKDMNSMFCSCGFEQMKSLDLGNKFIIPQGGENECDTEKMFTSMGAMSGGNICTIKVLNSQIENFTPLLTSNTKLEGKY